MSGFVGRVHLLESKGTDWNSGHIQSLFRHQPNVSSARHIEFGSIAEDDGRVLGTLKYLNYVNQ